MASKYLTIRLISRENGMVSHFNPKRSITLSMKFGVLGSPKRIHNWIFKKKWSPKICCQGNLAAHLSEGEVGGRLAGCQR